MFFIFSSFLFFILGAFFSLFLKKAPRFEKWLSTSTLFIGSLFGLIASLWILFFNGHFELKLAWSLPIGSFHIALDPLSAFFALALFIIAPLVSLFGFATFDEKKSYWINSFFSLLVASLFLILLSRDGFLLLFAWELMTLFSFFLIMTEHEKENYAGLSYLVASHLSGFFLFALFLVMGSFDFNHFSALSLNLAFVLTLIGFGIKAGFVPLHLWLPEAHSVAPSAISAFMSGVMIKMGLYGLFRMLLYLDASNEVFGWTLILLGALSGVFGILQTLTQKNIKRVLAYSSIENVGIILLALGTGVIGLAKDLPLMASFGFAAALLHLFNHAIYKSLLFFGTGAISKVAHCYDMDLLGGLFKKMKITSCFFLIGTLSIVAMPPFSGFISEYLLFVGALNGSFSSSLFALFSLGTLAFISGYALLTFSRAFAFLFLGHSRSEIAYENERGFGLAFFAPLAILALASLLLGLFGPILAKGLLTAVASSFGFHEAEAFATLQSDLTMVISSSFALFILILLLSYLRKRALAKRPVDYTDTWDCGYIAPSAKMQYTASSFSEPASSFYHVLLRTKNHLHLNGTFFPSKAHFTSFSKDLFEEFLITPLFRGLPYLLSKMRWVQGGRVQLYILYIALTLFLLLLWKM